MVGRCRLVNSAGGSLSPFADLYRQKCWLIGTSTKNKPQQTFLKYPDFLHAGFLFHCIKASRREVRRKCNVSDSHLLFVWLVGLSDFHGRYATCMSFADSHGRDYGIRSAMQFISANKGYCVEHPLARNYWFSIGFSRWCWSACGCLRFTDDIEVKGVWSSTFCTFKFNEAWAWNSLNEFLLSWRVMKYEICVQQNWSEKKGGGWDQCSCTPFLRTAISYSHAGLKCHCLELLVPSPAARKPLQTYVLPNNDLRSKTIQVYANCLVSTIKSFNT